MLVGELLAGVPLHLGALVNPGPDPDRDCTDNHTAAQSLGGVDNAGSSCLKGKRCSMFKKIGLGLTLLFGAACGFFLRLYRPWHSRWGATDEEVALEMPGDDRVKEPTFNVTRAITIHARPEEIWPWIIQIGFGRAGFYSYDLLDNLGKPSADLIIPELQHIEVGTWIPMSGKVTEDRRSAREVSEQNCWMLWEKAASTWAWKSTP